MKRLTTCSIVVAFLALLVAGLAATPVLAYGPGNQANNGPYLDSPTLARVAQVLGLSPADLTSRLQAGKTLAQIAADQKIATDKVGETIVSPYRDELQLQVKYGYLTQQQADSLIAQAQDRARTLIEKNLSQPAGNSYSLQEMQQDCNQMMGNWSGSQGSPGGRGGMMGNNWGGMMGDSSGNSMMGGWSKQQNSPDTDTNTSRGWTTTFGGAISQGWNGMMSGLRGMMGNLGGMGGMMGR